MGLIPLLFPFPGVLRLRNPRRLPARSLGLLATVPNPRRLPARSLGLLATVGPPPSEFPFPIAGEIVRLAGHGRAAQPTSLLAREPENSHPASGEGLPSSTERK
jgi:hypothetical protein